MKLKEIKGFPELKRELKRVQENTKEERLNKLLHLCRINGYNQALEEIGEMEIHLSEASIAYIIHLRESGVLCEKNSLEIAKALNTPDILRIEKTINKGE